MPVGLDAASPFQQRVGRQRDDHAAVQQLPRWLEVAHRLGAGRKSVEKCIAGQQG